jgi:hypothetical protein
VGLSQQFCRYISVYNTGRNTFCKMTRVCILCAFHWLVSSIVGVSCRRERGLFQLVPVHPRTCAPDDRIRHCSHPFALAASDDSRALLRAV